MHKLRDGIEGIEQEVWMQLRPQGLELRLHEARFRFRRTALTLPFAAIVLGNVRDCDDSPEHQIVTYQGGEVKLVADAEQRSHQTRGCDLQVGDGPSNDSERQRATDCRLSGKAKSPSQKDYERRERDPRITLGQRKTDGEAPAGIAAVEQIGDRRTPCNDAG